MIRTLPFIRRLRRSLGIAAIITTSFGIANAQTPFGTFGAGGAMGGSSTLGNSTAPNSAMTGGMGGSSNVGAPSGQGASFGSQNANQSGFSTPGSLGGASLEDGGNLLGTGAVGGRNGLGNMMPTSLQDESRLRADGAQSRKQTTADSGRSQEPPSQFQQFVQQATGRLLPVYGAELFERPEVYVADTSGPVSDEYVLGPGDDVRVQVWGGINYDGTLTIDRNGQVNIPRAGVVTLAGVRAKEISTVLRNQLSNTFANFNLNANLERLRTMQVYVVGQARQPGTYNLSSLSTLVNALFASGGPSANGSMRNIELKRNGNVITTFDLYEFIGSGDKARDVALQPGDVIVVPPVGARVAITGAIDKAAVYELKGKNRGQTSLREILALNGGVPVLATTKKALIERVVIGQNPPRQVQDLALDEKGLQEALADGDVITLLNISPAFGNAVTLQGNVAAPLRYRWFAGMRVRDLIPERDALLTPDYYQRKNLLVQNISSADGTRAAGGNLTDRVRGIVDQINWDYAAIERLDRDKLRTQLIPFNLAAAILQGDESQNLVLQPGDVVTIFSEKDLRLPVERQSRLVRIEGEVAAPGVYEALPGETVVQLLQRVGGLRPQAYLFGTEFQRESVRRKQQENLELLIRRLEQQNQSQMLYLAANRPSDSASQAALFQQQQAAGAAQIASLRRMRSNGRIALELNPESLSVASLPDLPLEDGDRIMIPPTPGFVSAVGAVNNESVLIYKKDKTVGDVLRSAGLREEADKELMFVLRADGSIVSRKDKASFFGDKFEGMALMPGDTLIVPEKLDRETTRNFVVRQVKDWTQILSQLGLSVAAIKVLRDL